MSTTRFAFSLSLGQRPIKQLGHLPICLFFLASFSLFELLNYPFIGAWIYEMSRLPRLHSEQDRIHPPSMPPIGSTTLSLKRKTPQEENADQPRKLPAISEDGSNQPLRPSRTAINRAARGAPPALTKPSAPPLRTSLTKRATSAPPKATVPVRPTAGRTTRRRRVKLLG